MNIVTALRNTLGQLEAAQKNARFTDHAAALADARRALAAHEAAAEVWTPDDDAAAASEGWIVSNTSDGFDEIQRLDEAGAFHEDAAAIAHVYWMAGTGSELHRRAILYTLRDGNTWTYSQGARP